MFDVLHNIEFFLLSFLLREQKLRWNSLLIDYHKPVVERLWVPFSKYRINLHKTHPCKREDALFHPHPWPSVIKILSGTYKMDVGYGKGDKEPPVACELILPEGSSYSMTDPDGWHRIYPVDKVSVSLMITGPPWARTSPGKGKVTAPLTQDQQMEILAFFRNYYPRCSFLYSPKLEDHLASVLGISIPELQKAIKESLSKTLY